jgi:hypothetical protein
VILRCGKCHATVWIHPTARRAGGAVACDCGQTYVLQRWPRLPGDERLLAKRARELAREQEIDLPGAYSVLLGTATVQELRELGGPASPACRTVPAEAPRPCRYDRAFQPAIDAGLLSEMQAAERGNRDAWASTLVARHRLSKEVAYDVTDNKLSLLEAIRRREAPGAPVHVALRRPTLGPVGLLAAVFVTAVVLVVVARRPAPVVVDARHGVLEIRGAEVRTDGAGRVVQVFGPSPRSVLEAYSEAADRRLEVLDVLPAANPDERSRIGLLRDPREPRTLRAITIHEDREAGRWRAGETDRPLVTEAAPAGAEIALDRR